MAWQGASHFNTTYKDRCPDAPTPTQCPVLVSAMRVWGVGKFNKGTAIWGKIGTIGLKAVPILGTSAAHGASASPQDFHETGYCEPRKRPGSAPLSRRGVRRACRRSLRSSFAWSVCRARRLCFESSLLIICHWRGVMRTRDQILV